MRSVWLGVLVGLLGCGRPPQPASAVGYSVDPPAGTPRIYSLGVHPLVNPRRMDSMYSPLVAYLEQATGSRFRLEASRSYEAFEQKLKQRSLDFALPNPYQTVRHLGDRYRVFAKMGNDEGFRGIILVRRDAGIESFEALRGLRIAFPARTALAATLLPQALLRANGLEAGRDYQPVYVGSQDSAMMSVFRGEVAAAATWPLPWHLLSQQRPELAAALVVQWTTRTLPNNALVARVDVPAEVRDAVRAALLRLPDDEAGRAVLARVGLDRFEPADGQTYAPVVEFLRAVEGEVGPLP